MCEYPCEQLHLKLLNKEQHSNKLTHQEMMVLKLIGFCYFHAHLDFTARFHSQSFPISYLKCISYSVSIRGRYFGFPIFPQISKGKSETFFSLYCTVQHVLQFLGRCFWLWQNRKCSKVNVYDEKAQHLDNLRWKSLYQQRARTLKYRGLNYLNFSQ